MIEHKSLARHVDIVLIYCPCILFTSKKLIAKYFDTVWQKKNVMYVAEYLFLAIMLFSVIQVNVNSKSNLLSFGYKYAVGLVSEH